MPEGIEVLVEDGLATIDFVDLSLKREGLGALLEHTPPEQVEPLTREKGAERVRYRVPLECAKAAGMVDEASAVDALASLPMDSFTDVSGFVETPGPSTANLHAQEVRTGVYADAYGGTTVVTEGDGSTVEVGQFVQPVGVEAPADGSYSDLISEGLIVIPSDVALPAQQSVETHVPADHTGVTENDPSGVSPLPTGDFAPATEPTTELTPLQQSFVEEHQALAAQPEPVAEPVTDAPAKAPTYDDGKPDMDWSRAAINDYAAKLTPPLDTTGEKNRAAAIQAIEDAIKAGAKAP